MYEILIIPIIKYADQKFTCYVNIVVSYITSFD